MKLFANDNLCIVVVSGVHPFSYFITSLALQNSSRVLPFELKFYSTCCFPNDKDQKRAFASKNSIKPYTIQTPLCAEPTVTAVERKLYCFRAPALG